MIFKVIKVQLFDCIAKIAYRIYFPPLFFFPSPIFTITTSIVLICVSPYLIPFSFSFVTGSGYTDRRLQLLYMRIASIIDAQYRNLKEETIVAIIKILLLYSSLKIYCTIVFPISRSFINLLFFS